jgi:magnesium chelatase family protein
LHRQRPTLNGRLEGDALRDACRLDAEGASLLRRAAARLELSARSRTRILRVARTIADLGGDAFVHASHLAEALQFRWP